MNLFKKIWYKNLKKGEPLSNLASDIGPLQGELRYQKFDNSGKLLDDQTITNTIVNQSKSSVIRLISQGTTPWVDATSPADYKISKMRFSNDQNTSSAQMLLSDWRKLEYYDISEASNRIAEVELMDLTTNLAVGGVYGAGGNLIEQTCGIVGGFDTDITETKTNIQYASDGYESIDTRKAFNIVTSSNPPSHNTLVVKFWKDDSSHVQANSTLLETVSFYNIDNITSLTKYPRAGTAAMSIENPILAGNDGDENPLIDSATGGAYRFITTPSNANAAARTEVTGVGVKLTTNTTYNTLTSLVFDYTLSSLTWKLYLEESTFASDWETDHDGDKYWDTMTFVFEKGNFNMINSVVPVTGINAGVGTTETARYGAGNLDYYSTLTPVYTDAATDFIDDYAVTFRVDMDHQSGNGNIATAAGVVSADRKIQYRKAYLFTENDQMFSSITFSPFEKDNESNFVIYWTIKAPID